MALSISAIKPLMPSIGAPVAGPGGGGWAIAIFNVQQTNSTVNTMIILFLVFIVIFILINKLPFKQPYLKGSIVLILLYKYFLTVYFVFINNSNNIIARTYLV